MVKATNVFVLLVGLLFSEGAFTSQIQPPPDNLVVMAKIKTVGAEPTLSDKSEVNWKLAADTTYVNVKASILRVLEVDSWNKGEALKFKKDIFVKVPKKDAKVGHQIKVWIEDQQYPGSTTPREITTSFDPPFWASPPKPPKH
jgi:hypothetical protein